MDCITEVLKGQEIVNSKIFWLLPKDQMENSGRNYTDVLTENILCRKDSMNYILKMLPLEIS